MHHGPVTAAIVIFGVGFVVELVGLAIAAHGFHRTWNEFSREDRFLAPVTAAAGRAAQRTRRVANRIFRRRPQPITVGLASATLRFSAVSVRPIQSYGPLPPIGEDQPAFADVVQRRLDELLQQVQRVEHSLSDEVKAVEERIKGTARTLDGRISEVEKMSQSIAVGGLREQVFGWGLIVVGFTLQGVAQLMQTIAAS